MSDSKVVPLSLSATKHMKENSVLSAGGMGNLGVAAGSQLFLLLFMFALICELGTHHQNHTCTHVP